jgi:muconolactone delta-isomerase
MIWGGINDVNPPYTITITHSAAPPDQLKADIAEVIEALEHERADHLARTGRNVEVAVKLEP